MCVGALPSVIASPLFGSESAVSWLLSEDVAAMGGRSESTTVLVGLGSRFGLMREKRSGRGGRVGQRSRASSCNDPSSSDGTWCGRNAATLARDSERRHSEVRATEPVPVGSSGAPTRIRPPDIIIMLAMLGVMQTVARAGAGCCRAEARSRGCVRAEHQQAQAGSVALAAAYQP
eukprot:2781402-Rhodomonas_salina.3